MTDENAERLMAELNGLVRELREHDIAVERVLMKVLERLVPSPHVEAAEGGATACSFCGTRRTQVKTMIAGPGVHICDQCIDLCNDIIKQEGKEERREAALRSPRAPSQPPPPYDDADLARWRAAVRDTRTRWKLTQDALGRQAGISGGRVSQIERGEWAPPVETARSLSNVLDLEPPALADAEPAPVDH